MKTALLVVDVQHDLLPWSQAWGVMLPACPVPEGDQIIHPLTLAARDCDLVIASRDWHPVGHEPAGTGQHCVQDSYGARIHSRVRRLANFTVSKGMDGDAYSAFEAQTLRPIHALEDLLDVQGVRRVIVGGLPLELTVRYTALDANALGLDTIVPLDCTRALDPETVPGVLAEFERAGVKVVDHWSA